MLVRRAEDIWEWPLSARLLATIVAITTGVVTSIAARAVLSILGF